MPFASPTRMEILQNNKICIHQWPINDHWHPNQVKTVNIFLQCPDSWHDSQQMALLSTAQISYFLSNPLLPDDWYLLWTLPERASCDLCRSHTAECISLLKKGFAQVMVERSTGVKAQFLVQNCPLNMNFILFYYPNPSFKFMHDLSSWKNIADLGFSLD